MQRNVETPKQYLGLIEGEQRELIEIVRKAIRKVAPEVKEGIGHGMLDYPGLANLAAQKRYVALYVSPEVLRKHKRNFPGVDAGKSCLRFSKIEQVDPQALERLLDEVRAFRQRKAQ